MFARESRMVHYLAFAAAVIAGFLAFVRVALPFAVSPGPLALNYVENSSRISTAGMPTQPQIARIADAGFDMVINLATSQAPWGAENERALVEQRGMRYSSIPVEFASPRKEDYERFAQTMRDNTDKRILVHCQMGMRASTFVFLYRVIELGEDPDRAFDDVERVWQPAMQWREFIRNTLVARGQKLPRVLN